MNRPACGFKRGGALIGGLWVALRSPNDRLTGFLSGAAAGLAISGAAGLPPLKSIAGEVIGSTPAPDAWADVVSGEIG